MLHTVDDLLGFTIHAVDGDIGRVHDLYFDDQRWTIRYLVVDTRHWLPGRRILLSPISVRRVDWAPREIVVALDREQIRRSPGVDTDQPVGRGRIALFRECYTLPYTWALGGFLWASAPSVSARPSREAPRRRPGDPHLRSTRLLRGYSVRAMDGEVGHVDGFLVDEGSWALRHVVVHTRHWRPGHRVLVPSEWIAWVSWIELAVHVDLQIEQITSAPDYDPSHPVTRADETRLSAYYGHSDRRRRDVHMAG
jgi:hypothetical protein